MKEKKLNIRDLVNQYQENCERINAIADACELEKRERNENEEAEYKALSRENSLLQMRMQAEAAKVYAEDVQPVDSDKFLRENLIEKNQKVTISLMREAVVTPQTTAALADTGIIPANAMADSAALTNGPNTLRSCC